MGALRIVKLIGDSIGLGHSADSFATSYRSSLSPIVLGGCGRSGTTLLRMMLDSHHRICCGPESSVFRRRALDPDSLAERFGFQPAEVRVIYDRAGSRPDFIDRFAALWMAKTGKSRWAEKTPLNVSRIGAVFRSFPEARFVHVLRDGRDVACSLRTHPRHRVENENSFRSTPGSRSRAARAAGAMTSRAPGHSGPTRGFRQSATRNSC